MNSGIDNPPGLNKPQDRTNVLLVLNSFRAEGTPRMALDLCRNWVSWGLHPIILSLERASAELRGDFEALHLPIHTMQYAESGVIRYLKLMSYVYRLSRRYHVFAALCMTPGLHSFAAAGARVAGVKGFAVHLGNPAGSSLKAQLLMGIGRPFTSSLICCSEYVRETAVNHWKVPRSATTVVYNGANLKGFQSARKLVENRKARESNGNRRLIIGMVGTLESHKDQDTLIRAAKLLQERKMCLEVRLIGEGTRRATLERLVESLAAPVRLLGSRERVADELSELDIFVFSTTEQEGLGIALIEAMYCGLPIVASDVRACQEVLDGGRSGRLVEPRNPMALAAAIQEVIWNREDVKARIDCATVRAEEKFSSEAMARNYANLLGVEEIVCQ